MTLKKCLEIRCKSYFSRRGSFSTCHQSWDAFIRPAETTSSALSPPWSAELADDARCLHSLFLDWRFLRTCRCFRRLAPCVCSLLNSTLWKMCLTSSIWTRPHRPASIMRKVVESVTVRNESIPFSVASSTLDKVQKKI